MSQLDKSNTVIEYFPQEAVVDRDGNIRTRASETPIVLPAWISVLGQSGTSARRAEQDKEGYETEQVLRLRLPRKYEADHQLQPQAKVRWQGQMWSVFGFGKPYLGSKRTEHYEYHLRRA